MIPIVTPETMRSLEQAVMDAGTSDAELIGRAAQLIAAYLDERVLPEASGERSVLAVAGPGNNGVDAIVAASMLARLGWRANALLVGRSDMSEHPELEDHLADVEVVEHAVAADVILDGIFGNSGRTALPDDAVAALQEIEIARSARALIVAVDCPTGMNTLAGEVADEIVAADVTLCISNPKVGMLKSPAINYLGELIVLDIAVRTAELDPDVGATLLDDSFVRSRLPERRAIGHKSQAGGLLIIGGAPGYFGAPRLAGEAALRTGCGYVGLAAPRSIIGAIASAVPELIYHPLSDADGRASARVVGEALTEGGRYDAVVCGPGLGRDEVATRFLSELFAPATPSSEQQAPDSPFGIPRRHAAQESSEYSGIGDLPLVLDADALNWLSTQEDWPALLADRACVLTPHVGEMARLLSIEPDEVAADPWGVARKAASEWRQVVVLKGTITCVATPDGELYVAPRATPELATPGTGDVLAGIVGALLTQGCAPADAAALGIYIGSLAGCAARQQLGTRSTIARDLIAGLSVVLTQFDSPAVSRLTSIR